MLWKILQLRNKYILVTMYFKIMENRVYIKIIKNVFMCFKIHKY